MLLCFFRRRNILQTFVLILLFSSGGERDCRHLYYFYCFLQEEKETVDICTNVIVFLQEEKYTADICTNFIVFLQEEKETVDICTTFIVFFRRRKRL